VRFWTLTRRLARRFAGERNGLDGHKKQRSTLNFIVTTEWTFTDVTRVAGLDIEMYGMGVAVGDYNNGRIFRMCELLRGAEPAFQNTGLGTFVDVTRKSRLFWTARFSTSATWFDYDATDCWILFVCNYVNWSPEH